MIYGFNTLFSSLAQVADLNKCLFLNDEPCVVVPTDIDMNAVELKHDPFMISLNKYAGSCIVLSTKIWVPKEVKDITVKAFNMIKNKDEDKAMKKHLSCNCKCKSKKTIL